MSKSERVRVSEWSEWSDRENKETKVGPEKKNGTIKKKKAQKKHKKRHDRRRRDCDSRQRGGRKQKNKIGKKINLHQVL